MHLFVNCRVTQLVWNFVYVAPGSFNTYNFFFVVDWLDSLGYVVKEGLSDFFLFFLFFWCFCVGKFGTIGIIEFLGV